MPKPGMDTRLEPDTTGDSDAEHVAHSIAISLKRISDAITGSRTQAGLVDAIGAAISQGIFEGSRR